MKSPYYQDDLITLFHGDCRDILPSLDGEFFTFTDPPYNVGKDYGGWNDSMPSEEYLDFCDQWIKEVKRLSPEICIYPPKKYLREYWNLFGGGISRLSLHGIQKGHTGADLSINMRCYSRMQSPRSAQKTCGQTCRYKAWVTFSRRIALGIQDTPASISHHEFWIRSPIRICQSWTRSEEPERQQEFAKISGVSASQSNIRNAGVNSSPIKEWRNLF